MELGDYEDLDWDDEDDEEGNFQHCLGRTISATTPRESSTRSWPSNPSSLKFESGLPSSRLSGPTQRATYSGPWCSLLRTSAVTGFDR